MIQTIVEPFDENTQVEKYKSRITLPPLWAEMARRDLPFPYSYLREEAPKLDLGDHAATAKWLNDKWGDQEGEYGADEEGLYQWSTYNPLSKWDWWALGGRWHGFYKIKPGAKGMLGEPGAFDNAPVPDAWDVARKGDIIAGPPGRDNSVQTYGVIDAEGKWYSPGDMGWWGMSTEDDSSQLKFDVWFHEEFWAKLDDDTWLAVCDFHI
jgi:hypothetical protein